MPNKAYSVIYALARGATSAHVFLGKDTLVMSNKAGPYPDSVSKMQTWLNTIHGELGARSELILATQEEP